MAASIVYLFEANIERAKEISDIAAARGYQVELVSELPQLVELIEKKLPDAVLIGYEWIKNSADELDFLESQFTIVYGEELDPDLRFRLYRAGISRVVEWNSGGATFLVHLVRIHIFRQRELKPLVEKYVTRGNMKEFHLREILLNGIYDKKNFILKILDDDWQAKIRTFQGEVVEAVCPGKAGIDAALDILQHQKGTFRMQSFTKRREVSTSNVSSYALAVEAAFETKILMDFLQQFGMANPVFKKNNSDSQDALPDADRRISELVQNEKEFRRILSASPYGFLKTTRTLDRLYRAGIINTEVNGSSLKAFAEEDVEFIREKLFKPGMKEGRLIVLGYPTSGKSQLIKTLAGKNSKDIKTAQSVDFMRIQLASDLRLNVFGISIDSYFQPMMRKLSSNMLACFYLVDCSQTDKNDYTKYLIQQFISNYRVPLVIALTRIQGNPEQVAMQIRRDLEIPPEIETIPLNPGDFRQVRQLFYHLNQATPIETRKEE